MPRRGGGSATSFDSLSSEPIISEMDLPGSLNGTLKIASPSTWAVIYMLLVLLNLLLHVTILVRYDLNHIIKSVLYKSRNNFPHSVYGEAFKLFTTHLRGTPFKPTQNISGE